MGRADQLASRAAAELYELHSRRIFGYCLSRLGAREDAEDATQLTFLHAVRSLRRGVVPLAESAWLLGIARNVCCSRWASVGRRSRVEETCDPTELERAAAAHDPVRDELIGVEHALGLLPEQQRRAVLLRDWRGLSYEEVAQQLRVSHAAAETLIFRGRAALARHLSGRPGGSRRHLNSLSGAWPLLEAIKSALTGAAAGAKVAAAVAVTITVSAAGIAVGKDPSDNSSAEPARAVAAATALGDVAVASTPTGKPPFLRRARPRPGTSGSRVAATAGVLPLVPAGAHGVVTPAETEPQTDVGVIAPPPVLQPATAPVPPAALPQTAQTLDASAGDAPTLDAPPLPTVELPAMGGVVAATEAVVVVTEGVAAATEPVTAVIEAMPVAVGAATEPVTAVVDETLASTPVTPAVTLPRTEPPLLALPPPPAVPVPGVSPSLP